MGAQCFFYCIWNSDGCHDCDFGNPGLVTPLVSGNHEWF